MPFFIDNIIYQSQSLLVIWLLKKLLRNDYEDVINFRAFLFEGVYIME
jgi:hypothetical protein